jgi:hypothetical protein
MMTTSALLCLVALSGTFAAAVSRPIDGVSSNPWILAQMIPTSAAPRSLAVMWLLVLHRNVSLAQTSATSFLTSLA